MSKHHHKNSPSQDYRPDEDRKTYRSKRWQNNKKDLSNGKRKRLMNFSSLSFFSLLSALKNTYLKDFVNIFLLSINY